MKRKKKQMNIISDTMEKYCKSCGRVFKDSDFKICPYCGNQLSTRTGRQSIPRKLRHQVFQRDGYRCRECGATNKQTRLHVDHIKPVAKGGTNDLSNLQTLCEKCNRAKYTDEWVGGETDLEVAENEIKEKLFKKLYVQLSDNEIAVLSKGYGIDYVHKDKFIRFLVNKYTEKEIYDVLTNYKVLQKEKSRRETTQDKINRWKRAGWGATQEEMERWEQARKDKGATQKKIDRKKQPKKELGFVEKARRAQARHKRSMVGQTSWVQDKTKQVNLEKDRRKKFIKEKNRKEEARLKSESTVVTGEVKCLGEGTYRYTYKTSDGQKGSIYGSSIEDLKIKSRQYKIQWNP